MINSIRRNVRDIGKEHDKENITRILFRKEYYKETLTGKYEDLAKFAKIRSISIAVRKHNDREGPVELHDVFALSLYIKAGEDLM